MGFYIAQLSFAVEEQRFCRLYSEVHATGECAQSLQALSLSARQVGRYARLYYSTTSPRVNEPCRSASPSQQLLLGSAVATQGDGPRTSWLEETP